MRRPRWTEPKTVYRWLTKRCEHCGHRFRWSRDARHSTGERDGKVYHGPCMSYLHWRRVAEERLDVVALACDVWVVDGFLDREWAEVSKAQHEKGHSVAVETKEEGT